MKEISLNTGIIILAAGSSSRLGTPKQMLVYKGKTLLQRAIETALASIGQPVIVVLGANGALIKPSIQHYAIDIVQNNDWGEGMSTSIRAGINELIKIKSNVQSAILMLCDQPFVDTWLLNHLTLAKPKSGIIACAYNNTNGPPVLFDRVYFEDLLLLKGAEGAKKIIQKYPDRVINVHFDHGSTDIDTMEDFEKLNLI